MDSAWGSGVNVLERTVDRHVSALRRKLDPDRFRIESITGEGYRFGFVGSTQQKESA